METHAYVHIHTYIHTYAEEREREREREREITRVYAKDLVVISFHFWFFPFVWLRNSHTFQRFAVRSAKAIENASQTSE